MTTVRQRIVASVTRRYPFYSGCGSLASHPFVQRIAGSSTETAWARVPGGYWAAAPLGDHVGRAIFYAGELDRKITWVCSRLVRPGDCVLDIGANLGLVALTLSALVGPSGQVHAFEPIPEMQELIEEAIDRNGVANIRLYRFALGERYGELTLSIPRENAGAASFVEARRWVDSNHMPVTVQALSSVMEGQDIDHIRLVKIDVEGYEPEVLTGGTEFFLRCPPDAFVFELNECSDLRNHPTLLALSDLGYGFFSLPKRLVRMHAIPFNPHNFPDTPESHDFVAARLGNIYDEVARHLHAV